MLALEGNRILDLTWQGPGPYCTMILGDLGAEVIRITAPASSGARQIDREVDQRSVSFQAVHRNKQSIQINLKSPRGREVFYELVRGADVVLEGFRPGVTKRLGVDYATLEKLNDRLVYCSITGYGQDGPYSTRPGHDINYISLAGVLDPIGNVDRPPSIPLNLIADYGGGGKDAALGILSALVSRGKTGKGQHVDISLTDSTISLLTDSILDYYFESGECLRRGEHPLNGGFPYYNVYETQDGKFVTIGCVEPWLWENFCRAVGKDEFIPFHFRLEHYLHAPREKLWKDILASLKALFLTKTRDEWFDYLVQKDVPVGKVFTLDEVFTDPQILHRKMVLEFEHPAGNKVRHVGIAIKLSGTPGSVRSMPPMPGQHTGAIVGGLGYSPADIDVLRKEGAID
jgi:alpha-methylacyl-CoA racemase